MNTETDAHPLAVAVGAVQKFTDEYVEGFETIGEDTEGREGYYTPNERERWLIQDAINGLVADEDFQRLCRDEVVEREKKRRFDGECVICGCKLPGHWGGCSEDSARGEHAT